jgi:hypothetical protein
MQIRNKFFFIVLLFPYLFKILLILNIFINKQTNKKWTYLIEIKLYSRLI